MTIGIKLILLDSKKCSMYEAVCIQLFNSLPNCVRMQVQCAVLECLYRSQTPRLHVLTATCLQTPSWRKSAVNRRLSRGQSWVML